VCRNGEIQKEPLLEMISDIKKRCNYPSEQSQETYRHHDFKCDCEGKSAKIYSLILLGEIINGGSLA